jgi:hypothetical protein
MEARGNGYGGGSGQEVVRGMRVELITFGSGGLPRK